MDRRKRFLEVFLFGVVLVFLAFPAGAGAMSLGMGGGRRSG